MLKFYMTPGSCSTGIHILLEELDLLFEVTIVNLLAGDQHRAEYLAINPKATIPVLVLDDGRVLTEFGAIAFWLARRYPKAQLLPDDAYASAKAVELIDYAVGTVHSQGFARLFTTEKFATQAADFDAVQQQGRDMLARAFDVLNSMLPDEGYALGRFSMADAALFYVEFWADKSGLALPERCQAHYRLMRTRPAVRRVLAEEGYRVD